MDRNIIKSNLPGMSIWRKTSQQANKQNSSNFYTRIYNFSSHELLTRFTVPDMNSFIRNQ